MATFFEIADEVKKGRRFKWVESDQYNTKDDVTWFSRLFQDVWELEPIKPEVVECEIEFVGYTFYSDNLDCMEKLKGKKWRAVFTEVIE